MHPSSDSQDGATFEGITPEGTYISERELFDLMWQAASRATEVCRQQGYGYGDKVTKDSARAAAEEVYRLHRPQDYQAPPLVLPAEPVVDVVQARMEREPGTLADDEPF